MELPTGQFVGFGHYQHPIHTGQTFQGFTDGRIDASCGGACAGRADRSQDAYHSQFRPTRKVSTQSVIFEEDQDVFDVFLTTVLLHDDDHRKTPFAENEACEFQPNKKAEGFPLLGPAWWWMFLLSRSGPPSCWRAIPRIPALFE